MTFRCAVQYVKNTYTVVQWHSRTFSPCKTETLLTFNDFPVLPSAQTLAPSILL